MTTAFGSWAPKIRTILSVPRSSDAVATRSTARTFKTGGNAALLFRSLTSFSTRSTALTAM